jgi:hypothetical protein
MAKPPKGKSPPRLSRAQRRAEFLKLAEQHFEALEEWYDAHPDASFEEIEGEARRQRRELMGAALTLVINSRDSGYQLEAPRCPSCGVRMAFEGYRSKQVVGLEGDSQLQRAYYVCPAGHGETLFPPGSETAAAPGPLE